MADLNRRNLLNEIKLRLYRDGLCEGCMKQAKDAAFFVKIRGFDINDALDGMSYFPKTAYCHECRGYIGGSSHTH